MYAVGSRNVHKFHVVVDYEGGTCIVAYFRNGEGFLCQGSGGGILVAQLHPSASPVDCLLRPCHYAVACCRMCDELQQEGVTVNPCSPCRPEHCRPSEAAGFNQGQFFRCYTAEGEDSVVEIWLQAFDVDSAVIAGFGDAWENRA